MTDRPMTPAGVAELDQLLAEADRQLDGWLAALRQEVSERGEAQALANAGLALSLLPEDAQRGLLIAALPRLIRNLPGDRNIEPEEVS